jgi:hypothetical protein
MEIPNVSDLNNTEKIIILLTAISVIFGSGVYIGNHTAPVSNNQVSTTSTTYEELVQKNMSLVDGYVQNVKTSAGNVSIGQFRANCQESQQKINQMLLDVKTDTDPSHAEINKQYTAFLIQSYMTIDDYLNGKVSVTSTNIV